MSLPTPTLLCVASGDERVRERALAHLQAQGYLTTEAATLDELAAAVRAGAICAVVDPRMPELGDQPESRLRAEPALHSCPLILLSEGETSELDQAPPGQELVHLLVRISAQLAANAQLELLHHVSQTLTATTDMDRTLAAVLESVAEVVTFDTGTFFVLEAGGTATVRATWGYDMAMAQLRTFNVGEGVVGWVVANRAPTIVGDSDLDGRFVTGEGRSSRSMLAVPIMIGDRVIGVLTLVRRAPAVPFTDSDLALVATIGNSAAIALENARMRQQERALAMRLEEVNQLYGHEREILDRLQQYNRLYTDVVSTVSHELKTPLMSIRGYAKMIEDADVEGAEARDFAKEIRDNAVRLSAYVERVLQEDAVVSGRQSLDLRILHVGPLVDQVFRSLRTAATEEHELINDVDESVPSVRADPEKLAQILNNLVGNAIKYSPTGGRIRVSAEARERYVEVAVEDQGVGIPADALPRIFERFYRVHSFETRAVTGTGLGLSIVKGLVELHGGEIGVSSSDGEGSRFFFTVPRAVYSAADTTEFANLARSGATVSDEK